MTDKIELTGAGNVTAKLTARGEFLPELQRSVNGAIKVNMQDGIVKGIDVTQIIRKTYAKYKRQPVPRDEDGKNQTEFSSMNISFQVTNGLMKSQDLVMYSDLPLIRGVGTVNLVNNRIDYTVKTSLDKKLVTMIGQNERYVGNPARIFLKGPLNNINYEVDWKKTLFRAAEKNTRKKHSNPFSVKRKRNRRRNLPHHRARRHQRQNRPNLQRNRRPWKKSAASARHVRKKKSKNVRKIC